MLVTGDSAGTLVTRSAGLIDFRATLEWDEAPLSPPPCLPAPETSFRHDLEQTLEPTGALLRISGTIRSMTDRGLGAGLDLVVRSVGNAAALSGAVLEMRFFREHEPRAAPPGPLQALALDLWRAGFAVRFAPSWTPAGAGPLLLGGGGEEEALREFLLASPLWEPS